VRTYETKSDTGFQRKVTFGKAQKLKNKKGAVGKYSYEKKNVLPMRLEQTGTRSINGGSNDTR